MTSAPPPDRQKPAGRIRRPRNSPQVFVAAAAVLILAAFCVRSSVARVFSDRWLADPTEENIRRATAWTPRNSLAWLRLGELLARRAAPGSPESREAIEFLQRSVELHPYQTMAWIALALQVELDGDPELAEKYLMRAVETDVGFPPRWSLANFYLRQNRLEEFWKWSYRAIEAYPQGLETVADLCWRAFDDPELILDNAIPDAPEPNRRYFSYLLRNQYLEAAIGAWPRASAHLQQETAGLATGFVSQLLRAGRVDTAVEAWNRVCQLGHVAGAPLSFETGPLLANGDLRSPPSGQGFDLAPQTNEGIRWRAQMSQNDYGALLFEFDGTHAEGASLLQQLVPVQPGELYRFDFVYQSRELPNPPGLFWVIFDAIANVPLHRGELLPASEEWAPHTIPVRVGPAVKLLRIELRYRRAPGTTREKGVFALRELAFDPFVEDGSDLAGGGLP